MYNFPKNFSHIGIVEFELEQGKGKDKIIHQMILMYNSNYVTADEAFNIFNKNEYSDYMFAIPKSIFNGVFKNAGLGGNVYGILS